MILFVFEGSKREPDLFRTIQRLYFPNKEEQICLTISSHKTYHIRKNIKNDGIFKLVDLKVPSFF